MRSQLWAMLTSRIQDQVDALVSRDRKIEAVRTILDSVDEPSRPGLYDCLDLVAERYAVLGKRFHRSPTPPLDLEALTAGRRSPPLVGLSVADQPQPFSGCPADHRLRIYRRNEPCTR